MSETDVMELFADWWPKHRPGQLFIKATYGDVIAFAQHCIEHEQNYLAALPND